MKNISMLIKVMLVLTVAIFIWSGINPFEYQTWLLEVFPAIIGFALIAYYWKNFRISDFLLVLICIHTWILCVGGHYTYAKVPAGVWFQELFGLHRNHYDRLGHFAQGFVPAFLAREILLRKHVLKNDGWLKLIVISICLAFSAFYELIEFSVALILGQGSDAFLGTQGDVWDTQKDMATALLGVIVALCFARWHDRAISKVRPG
jgi:putative membrane protein